MIPRGAYGHMAISRSQSTSLLIPLLRNCPQHLSLRTYSSLSKNRRTPGSSTSKSTAVPKTTTSDSPSDSVPDPINPPPSTRPAPLVIPEPDPNRSGISNLLTTGKAYLTFYKTGLKNTWSNWRAVDALRLKHGVKRTHPESLFNAVTRPGSTFTRSDYQLMRRAMRDIRRLPLFGAVLAICGEFTPLVVLFMSGAVPKVCWIPRQVQKSREKVERRRAESFKILSVLHEQVQSRENSLAEAAEAREKGETSKEDEILRKLNTRPPPPPIAAGGQQPLTLVEVKHLIVALGLSPRWLVNRFTAQVWMIRLRGYLQYLLLDDMLIHRAGGVEGLNDEELMIAAEERGLDVLGVQKDMLRWRLGEWVDVVMKRCQHSYNDGFLAMGELLVSGLDEWDELMQKGVRTKGQRGEAAMEDVEVKVGPEKEELKGQKGAS